MKKLSTVIIIFFIISITFTGCRKQQDITDYSEIENWAYCEIENTQKTADVFFICPTVYGGSENEHNMRMDDADTKKNFLGAVNMEKGIYDEDSRFFAPYYQQAGFLVYEMPIEDREPYLELAYSDVKAAFEYYMENYNEGRPIIIAGFSQGADLSIRLMKDCFADKEKNDLLVACYAIGWSITEEELEEYSHLRFAAGESDTGVIVSFNSEAENINESLMIPAGTKTLAINPLNWKCDESIADKSLNDGACFTDYDGNIVTEILHLTGAYIDLGRGALKVTDVTPEEYPAGVDLFEDGIYHLYDYQFFYRNLQKNVKVRIEAFNGKLTFLPKANTDITFFAEKCEIGGLGIYMVKKTMNDVSYEYKDGQNILRIKKKF